MEMIIPHRSIWNRSSIKCIPLGLYFRISLNDWQRRFTYVQWFRGYGSNARCLKECVYEYHTKKEIVLERSVLLEAFKLLVDYRLKNQF